jgi:hypothetical protein
MELANFKGTIYGKLKHQLFIWDTAWESFRPIDTIGWNGIAIVPVYSSYTSDIFSEWYGFGSEGMKQVCEKLNESVSRDIAPTDVIPWLKGEWWRDRQCSFTSDCISRSPASWSKYIKYMNSKSRTLRRHIDGCATKRLVPK